MIACGTVCVCVSGNKPCVLCGRVCLCVVNGVFLVIVCGILVFCVIVSTSVRACDFLDA